MNKVVNYITSIGAAIESLGKGMIRTGSSMVHPSRILTQQYPENRETLYIPDRFLAELQLLRDAAGVFKCVACTLCQTACPNDSIQIETEKTTTPDGKSKRVLSRYSYDLGRCTFCGQCIDACNFDALAMTNHFETSEYDKRKLVKVLNEVKPTNEEEKQA